MQHRITTPCPPEALRGLRAGDSVLLSGVVYTARDAAHKRMIELLDAGKELPYPIQNSAVYYVGPTPARPGQPIGSAGPTTSGRMDPYTPRLAALGQTVLIGKGPRDEAVQRALRAAGGVYLAAAGGAGALLASCVETAELVCWEDLGCEAVRRLTVKDLPLTVVLDAHGGNWYAEGPARWRAKRTGTDGERTPKNGTEKEDLDG